jgi:hypothetical protein
MLEERHLGRRRYPRYNTDKALQAQIYQLEHASNHVQGRMQQFGEGGLGALMTNQLTVGQVICVELAQDLHVYATVRYLRGYNHGFEFVMVTERQRSGIRKICQTLVPRVYSA